MIKRLRHIVRFSNWLRLGTFLAVFSLLLSYLCPFVHPESFKILPFFGLAYPIIVIINLLFLLFWIFRRKRIAWLIVVALVLGLGLHFRSLATVFSQENAPKNASLWKVMSYNVRLFDVYNEDVNLANEHRKSIIDFVVNNEPDVVCFQEFYHQDKPTKFSTRDVLIDLLKIKGYHERYSHKRRNRQNFGISLLSKYPVIAKGDVMFDNFSSTDNYCIFSDIVKGKDTLRVYSVHLQSIKLQQQEYSLFGEKGKEVVDKKSTIRLLIEKLTVAYPARANQALKVIEHMETSPYPVIVCGDFNDTPMSFVYNQFNKQLIDAFRNCSNGIGKTYVGRVPAGRIDYIFHDKRLNSQNFHIQEKPFSDHRAIFCELWKKE